MFVFFALLCCQTSYSKNKGGVGLFDQAYKKQADKQKSRWTLESWLEQRDRNRMMDLWLAINSSSPYEYYLGVDYKSYTSDVNFPVSTNEYQSYRGYFAAYAYIVGLEYQYENNTQENYFDHTGIFHFRLLGNAAQSTNITLQAGLRSHHSQIYDSILRQSFAGASATFYLLKKFGITGLYRQYFPYLDATAGEITGDRYEGGAFIEFDFLRVYGTYFDETLNFKSTIESEQRRRGIESGIRFYF